MKNKLYCISNYYLNGILFKAGNFYTFRDEKGEDAIYIFYDNSRGCKFRTTNESNQFLDYYKKFFITLKEYRKLKLERINKL